MRKKPEKSKRQRKPKLLKNQKCQNKPKQANLSELTETPI